MELIAKLFDMPWITQVILILFFVNAILSGLSVTLEKIKDKTESQWDNKLADYVSKGLGYLQKVVDFISANQKH